MTSPLVAELVGKEFVQTTTPPGAGCLHGSVQTGRCLWTVGVAAETTPDGFEKPFAAVGKHRPDAGHGLAAPACNWLLADSETPAGLPPLNGI